jgi:oxazoline/thiazoline synthase
MRVALAEQRVGPIVVRTLGAGVTAKQATARARMEMIERLCGFFAGDEPFVRATRRELGDAAIDPNDVLLFSKKQIRRSKQQILRFAQDDRGGAQGDRKEWSPLLDSATGAVRFLPTELLYYRYGRPGRRGLADSNGVAAGRGVADAACRALLELIERDSVALWWYNRVQRPRLALERMNDPFVRRALAWHRNLGRECWALDLTSDLGVPVVAAVSAHMRPARQEIVLGFGASLDGAHAVHRALLETGQMLALTRAADDGLSLSPAMRKWLRHATLATREHLLPRQGRPAVVRRTTTTRDAGAMFDALRRRLRRRGLQALLLDLSRARFGASVVRVVVPGLRPWWPRFAPGRLFDAPVAAGWQPRRKRAAEMNPEPVFF